MGVLQSTPEEPNLLGTVDAAACPLCNAPDSGVRVEDGGSKYCLGCEKIYHKCKFGIKVGGPGPVLCPDCSPWRMQADKELV